MPKPKPKPRRRQNKTPKSPEEAKEFMGEQHQDNEVQLERLATITEYEQYKQIENEFRCFLIQGSEYCSILNISES